VSQPNDLLEELRSIPDRLAVAARDAPQVTPGEWSATEVIRHLVAVEEEVWHLRLDQLSTEEEPRWSWTEPGPWNGPGCETLASALAVFAERRAATVARLEALEPAGWRRIGTHETFGRIDVRRLIEIALEHDREHLGGLGAPAAKEGV
jgi:hypothetical protein